MTNESASGRTGGLSSVRWAVTLVLLAIVTFVGVAAAGRRVPPGVQTGDNGELQLVVRELGVAHPPGYALYTMAAHGFARVATVPAVARILGASEGLLAGDEAGADAWTWAANLFSATLAMATLLTAAAAAASFAQTGWAGLAAALVLGASATFIAQSLVANIRMPTALFAALWLAMLAAARAERGGPGLALSAGLLLGLSLSHHSSLAAIALPMLAAVAWTCRTGLFNVRSVGSGVLGVTLGLLPLAYLPWRDATSSLPAPADLTTVAGFLEHATAAGFRGDMLAFTSASELGMRLPVLINIFRVQFVPLPLVGAMAVVGTLWLVATRPPAGLALVGAGLLSSAAVLTYRAPQTMEYLMPAYVVVAVAAGCSLGLAQAVGRRVLPRFAWVVPSAVAAALAAALVAGGAAARPALAVEAAYAQSAPVAGTTVRCGPAGTVLSSWHYWAPLEYARRHFAPREDMRIQYVFPEGAEPIGATWLRHVQDVPDVVMLTDRPREVQEAGTQLWPAPGGPFFALRPTDCDEAEEEQPAGADFSIPVGAGFEDRAVLAWAVLRREWGWDHDAQPSVEGPWAPVRLNLEFLPPSQLADDAESGETDSGAAVSSDVSDSGLTVFAQLIGSDGKVYAQADQHFDAARWSDPEGLVASLMLVPFREGMPERLTLEAGVYAADPEPVRLEPTISGSDPGSRAGEVGPVGTGERPYVTDRRTVALAGLDSSDLWPWWGLGTGGLMEHFSRDTSARPVAGIPFGSAMTLLGATVGPGKTDGELVVDLDWLAEKAYMSDYRVSVQVWPAPPQPDAASGGAWTAQHDGVPLIGAVPTLKWLPGMRFRDSHVVQLPEGVTADADFQVGVSVYDSFTGEPLPVADRTRVEQGQGQRALVWPPGGAE